VGRRPDELAVALDLAGPDLDRKVAALSAMASQVGPALAVLGPERFAAQAADECFVAVDPAGAGPERPLGYVAGRRRGGAVGVGRRR
jgi:hypothetical protein